MFNNPTVTHPSTEITLSSLPGGFHAASPLGYGIGGACGTEWYQDWIKWEFVSRSGLK